MRKFFAGVARFFAAIFAILFVVTMIVAVLLFNVDRNLFAASTFKAALTKNQVYERLPALFAEEFTSLQAYLTNPCAGNLLACKIDGASPELQSCLTNTLGQEAYQAIGSGQRKPTEAELTLAQPCLDQYGGSTVAGTVGTLSGGSGAGGTSGQGGMPPFMQNLKASVWEALLKTLATPQDLQTMTESVLDQMFAYLNSETDTVKLSLVKLKERLTGQASLDAVKQLILAQPACTLDQLTQMVISAIGGTGGMVLCNPGEGLLTIVMPLLQEQLNAVAAQIPDEVVIIKPPAPGAHSSSSGPFGADPVSTIRTARLIMRLSPLLPLAFLLLVTIFAVRSLKGWLRWWGIPAFITGLITFALALAASITFASLWVTIIAARMPAYLSSGMVQLAHDLTLSILQPLIRGIGVTGIIVGLIGLGMWIGSYFVKTKTGPDGSAMPLPPTA